MSTPVEDLIGEIATTDGIAVGRDDPKARAERVLNAALNASRQTMDEAAAAGARSAVEAVRREMERGANTIAGTVNGLRWLIMVNLLASVVALGAALLALSGKL